jgi:UDP-N-acetylglucosamine--dolichyl-phosphate N-acetylglucosaminephosphotransferase
MFTKHLFPLLISALFSIFAYFITRKSILLATPLFIRKGLTGKDMLKKSKPVIAESMGTIVGCVYFVFMFLFIPVPFVEWSLMEKDTLFPHERFAQYLGGLLSLFSMLFLGFADDILDIRWRVKIWFPFVASVPLLMVYYVTYGKTDVLVPIPLRFMFNSTYIPLGSFYYFFLSCICVFSTNGINILAGANGIEAIQVVVISISLVINNIIQLNQNLAKSDALINTLYFLFPFIGASLGFTSLNWYPASAFGGDTFCYFSGMVFAVVVEFL